MYGCLIKDPRVILTASNQVLKLCKMNTVVVILSTCMCGRDLVCVHAPVCTHASVCSEVESYLHMLCYAKLYESYGNLFKILIFSVKSTVHNNVIAYESSILTPEMRGNRHTFSCHTGVEIPNRHLATRKLHLN